MSETLQHVPTGIAKKLLGGAVVVIALGAVAFGVLREARNSAAARSAPVAAVVSATPTVYYFHGDTRCETCLAIEKQTTELVQSAFAEDITAGRVQLRVVNYDLPADRHFRDDYKLSFGSVVVATGDNSKWENLSDVWSLVHDDRASFDNYLISHIQPYIKAGP